MAEQKNTQQQPQQRGKKKKSDKKQDGSGAPKGRSSKRRYQNYKNRNHKAKNVARNLAKQRENAADANRPGRTPAGTARAMRRASVNSATGATSNLAEVERKMHSPSPEEQRYQDAKERLVQAIFGVDADGNKVPKPPDPIDAIFEQAG